MGTVLTLVWQLFLPPVSVSPDWPCFNGLPQGKILPWTQNEEGRLGCLVVQFFPPHRGGKPSVRRGGNDQH